MGPVDPVLHVLSLRGTAGWDCGAALAPRLLRSSWPLLHWELGHAMENGSVLVQGFGLAPLRHICCFGLCIAELAVSGS